MFLPSFFTGSLIGRFGAFRILWSGVAFYLGSIFLAVTAAGFWPYWLALVAAGLGWNFLFVGGTILIFGISLFMIDVKRAGLTHNPIDKVGTNTLPASSVFFDNEFYSAVYWCVHWLIQG